MIIEVKSPLATDLHALANRSAPKVEEPLAEHRDLVVSKPWGSEYLLFQNDDVAIWILEIEAGHGTSMHCHPEKNTSLLALGGEGCCRTLNTEYALRPGSGVYFGKKVFHQSLNRSDRRLYLMEIESPVDKYDLVRLQDDYGRVRQGYEGKDSCAPVENLTIRGPIDETATRSVHIGNSRILFGYARELGDLQAGISGVENAVVTILDRHVWHSNGRKFLEVGQAFRLDGPRFVADFHINSGFHYLLIAGGTDE